MDENKFRRIGYSYADAVKSSVSTDSESEKLCVWVENESHFKEDVQKIVHDQSGDEYKVTNIIKFFIEWQWPVTNYRSPRGRGQFYIGKTAKL